MDTNNDSLISELLRKNNGFPDVILSVGENINFSSLSRVPCEIPQKQSKVSSGLFLRFSWLRPWTIFLTVARRNFQFLELIRRPCSTLAKSFWKEEKLQTNYSGSLLMFKLKRMFQLFLEGFDQKLTSNKAWRKLQTWKPSTSIFKLQSEFVTF